MLAEMSDQPDAKAQSVQQNASPVVASLALTERDIRAGLIEIGGGVIRRGLFMALVVVLFVAFLGRNGGMTSPTTIAPLAFMVVLYAVFSFLIPSRNAKNQIEVLRRAGDTNVTYRFDEQGVTIQSAGASASIAYCLLVKTRRGKRTLLLFTTGQIAQIVPLRAFTAGELERVLAWLPPDQRTPGTLSGKGVVVLWVALVVAFLAIWQFLSP
jgi:hypothetical protein